MKFTYKSAEEIGKMSAEEQNKYLTDKTTHETEVRKQEIADGIKPVQDDVTEIAKDITAIKEDLRVVGERAKGTEAEEADLRTKVLNWVTENHADIIDKMKSGGKIDISKAVGVVTTANGTLPTALPVNFVAERQGVPNVRLRRPYLFDIVNSFNTSEKSLAYVEAIPGEGDFAITAEGVAKNQLDLDWVTRYVTPSKFAGWIHVTDEVLYDIPRITDMIVNYLKDKHDLFKDNAIFNYINATAITYAPSAATTGKVTNPNIIDAINALQLQVINTPNYVDEPDFYADTVLMNPTDFFLYFSTVKDAMGRNLYSDVMMLGGSMIYNGLRFISTSKVPVGEIRLFDSSKIDVTNYEPYHVEMGWINDDFIKNQRVILGESRGHIYIKEHDKRAFVKGTIATIIADLKKA